MSESPRMRVGRETVRSIASRWGTPFYLYAPDVVESAYREILSAARLADVDMTIAYSLKTNNLPAVVRTIAHLGGSVEVVSSHELELAVAVGFEPERIVLNGVVKDAAMLEFAATHDVRLVNVESHEQARLLSEAAVKADREISVGLRINPHIYPFAPDPFEDWIRDAGKFGFSVADPELVSSCCEIASLPGLNVRGLHFHLGSQITRPDPYVEALTMVERVRAALKKRGVHIEVIDTGGGLPCSGMSRVHRDLFELRRGDQAEIERSGVEGAEFDYPALMQGLARIAGHEDTTFLMEPGRALVGSAMAFVAKVEDTKQIKDRSWLILDGGVSHLPTMGPNERHRIELIGGGAVGKAAQGYSLAGPACFRGDILASDIRFDAEPRIGDLIVIHDVGAYSFSMANSFNAFRAPVIDASSEPAQLVWRREHTRDVYSLDATHVFG